MEPFAPRRQWILKGGSPLLKTGFAFLVLLVAAVNFFAYMVLLHQLSKHHPTDHDLVLPAILMFIALQLPWLGTIGPYHHTKNIVTGTGSGSVEQFRGLELFRISIVYTAILLILTSISSMLR